MQEQLERALLKSKEGAELKARIEMCAIDEVVKGAVQDEVITPEQGQELSNRSKKIRI